MLAVVIFEDTGTSDFGVAGDVVAGVERRWDALEAAEPELREAAERAVVRRAWCRPEDAGGVHGLFKAERDGRTGKSPRTGTPPRGRAFVELGYDADDRLVLARERRHGEERASYTRYDSDGGECCTFQLTPGGVGLSSVQRLTFDGERLAAIDECVFAGGVPAHPHWHPWTGERYVHDERGRLAQITEYAPGVMVGEDPPQRIYARTLTVIYDGDGDVAVAVRDRGDGTWLWRRPSGRAAAASKAVLAEMEHATYAWAGDVRPEGPVYALIIGWSPTFPLSPTLVLASARRRAAVLETCAGDLGHHLWNVAELVDEPQSSLSLNRHEIQLLEQSWRDLEDDEAPRKFYAKLAKALAARDYSMWSRTDDFVVVAIDVDTVDEAYRARQMRASVPAETVRELSTKGWLA